MDPITGAIVGSLASNVIGGMFGGGGGGEQKPRQTMPIPKQDDGMSGIWQLLQMLQQDDAPPPGGISPNDPVQGGQPMQQPGQQMGAWGQNPWNAQWQMPFAQNQQWMQGLGPMGQQLFGGSWNNGSGLVNAARKANGF